MATVRSTSSRLRRPSATLEVQPVERPAHAISRWAAFALVFGLFLTFRGYHSFDGDQAYRLPLLFHQQDASLYAADPFVRAFDTFNPHRGYLALLDYSSRPFGLATALLGLFALTLAMTSLGVDRLTRSIWPEKTATVGLVAVVLVLIAKGGNIGTNHLFESTLLDRLIGFAFGWIALAWSVGEPRRGVILGPVLLGLATLVHPSVGLQIALTLGTAWVVWGVFSSRSGVSRLSAFLALSGLVLALLPSLALMAGQSVNLFKGLPSEEFRHLAVLIQGPQHMLPTTWRMPQWLAWGCYPVLATLALISSDRPWPASRVRLAFLMGVNLASLGVAYLAVEVVGDLRVTIFQPFRMATLARGLALVAISGRVISLWERGELFSRGRAGTIASGLAGDWCLVVATTVDVGMAALERLGFSIRVVRPAGLAILAIGFVFLIRRDLESGQFALLLGIGVSVAISLLGRWRNLGWSRRRVGFAIAIAWAVPLASLVVGLVAPDPAASRWSAALVERCRFAEVPTDDLERLAVWARGHTPADARFISPPGPKTFRLWSRRSVAFNRAASPYHAEGLADWARRFREHVGFQGSTAEFARAYLADRHALEAGYGRMTDVQLANLARLEQASHVLASSAMRLAGTESPLVQLRVEGRYAIYKVVDAAEPHPEEILEKNSSDSLFNRN